MSAERGSVEDDGLCIPDVGAWGLEKYEIVAFFDRVFSKAMKKKRELAYVDLFSGAGYSRIKGTPRIVKGSPLLALDVPDQFSKYVFCEENPALMDSLKHRVLRDYSNADVTFLLGDCNQNAQRIVDSIPIGQVSRKHLTFCFVDPFGVHFAWSTILELASACQQIDLLVLLALEMDVRRNEVIYVEGKSGHVDDLLDDPGWRDRWSAAKARRVKFARFVAEEFAAKMFSLGYLRPTDWAMKPITTGDKTVPLYHLAFFSRHELGYKFWKQALKYRSKQGSLDLRLA